MPIIPKRHLTFISSSLAFFSNVFIMYIPFMLNFHMLDDMGIEKWKLGDYNTYIIAAQMLGLFVGSLGFSMWIEKKGRLFILFISIFIYSIGTIVGGLVDNFYVFIFLRFIVGLALAPELGIGLVLIAEMYNKYSRSFVISFHGFIGFSAVSLLSYLSPIMEWRDIYIYGGLCSMLVMLVRFSSYESDIYLNLKKGQIKRLEIVKLVFSRRFLYLLLLILPIFLILASTSWIGVNIIESDAQRFNKNLGPLYFSIGLIFGVILYSIVGYKIKSRIKLVKFSLVMQLCLGIFIFYNTYDGQQNTILPFMKNYLAPVTLLMGFFSGYIFELIILFMESYGTNKRGGATTLFMGFARFSIFGFIIAFNLIGNILKIDNFKSFFIVVIITNIAGLWASTKIKEEYNKDLNFTN